ncbi:MAG: alpha/beta hydrolase [Bacteroidetes bacterium]|nr:alpha/beta hydrolase [Bacteroidota bacterium]
MKEIDIQAADSHKIRNIIVENGTNHLVLLAHGITTEKNEEGIYTYFAENILSPDFDSLRFDFRGHGDSNVSSKNMRISGEILDLMAVLSWANKSKYKDIHLVAASFGGSIVLLANSIFNLDYLSSVTLWSPVISYQNTFINSTVEWGKEFFNQSKTEDLAYRHYTQIPETDFLIGPELTMELLLLHPESTLWPINIPLMIIHGTTDTLVPYNDAIMYANNNKSVLLHSILGVDHGFDEKIDEAYQFTKEWISKHKR